MADTLSNFVPGKTNPKLIETNNFMIINGNLYNKGNLAPASKKIFSFGSELGNNILHISRSMHLTDNARVDKRSKIVDINEDIYIENRSYIILNGQYSNVNDTTSFIISLNENDNDIELLNSYNEEGLLFQKIVCITDDNIIAVAKRINANSSPGQIYCFNKNLSVIKVITLNSTWWYSYDDPGKGEISKVYEDNTFLYILNNGHDNGGGLHSDLTVICKLNKNSLEYEKKEVGHNIQLPTETVDHVHSLYKYGNNVYFFYYRANDTRAASRNDIYKCIIDTTSALSITMIKTETYNNMKNIFFAERIYRQLGYFIKDNFLFYYIADETNSSSSVLNYQGIHKIRISGDFNLSYVKRINTSTNNRIISILFNENYETIIIGYWQAFDILVYNDVTQEYQKMGNTYTGIKNVGFDALNRLWYETMSGEIHTENFDDPQDVIVKFEKPYYSYLSGEIETYLTFQARSATGVAPTGRYILRITSGNAYFKETGTNELIINYESISQDDDHYPLMITGAKRIVCNVSFEKVW